MHLNYQLRGPATADEVAGLALALLDNAGVTTLRRDACMALELVVSLPANTTVDHREYFAAAVAWADAYFNVPILSAAVHLDEAAPHCHILLLPLVSGRMQGGALAGGPAKIRAMLADFQQQVAQRFGMTHQPRAKRLSKPNRDAAGRMVLDALRARPERLREPAMRDALVAALGSQAETLLALLGLSMPTTKAKAKSFADIMTTPCKPERARRAAPNTKHIDVAQNLGNQDGEKFDNVYLCVDVSPSPSSIPATEQPLAPATDSTADQHPNRTDFVRLFEQREPTIGDDQRQHSAENSAQQQAARVEQRQSDTDQRQSADTRLSFQDAPAASDERRTKAPAQVDQPDEIRRLGAGATPLPPSSAIWTKPDHVPARTSSPTPATGGSLDRRPARPPVGNGTRHQQHAGQLPLKGELRQADDYQRQRDTDHLAASWDEQRGEFVQATGPPPSACHLYP
jgi:hypothetical protein